MRKIFLSALFALGIGLAGATTASAAPVAAGYTPAANATLIEQIQYRPHRNYRHRHRYRYCYNVRRCYITRHHRRVCRIERICRWRWR